MSISWVLFWRHTAPSASDACRTNCPSDWRILAPCGEPRGEHHAHQLGTVLATPPPKPFGEPGAEHHEHQLGTVLATPPPQ